MQAKLRSSSGRRANLAMAVRSVTAICSESLILSTPATSTPMFLQARTISSTKELRRWTKIRKSLYRRGRFWEGRSSLLSTLALMSCAICWANREEADTLFIRSTGGRKILSDLSSSSGLVNGQSSTLPASPRREGKCAMVCSSDRTPVRALSLLNTVLTMSKTAAVERKDTSMFTVRKEASFSAKKVCIFSNSAGSAPWKE